MIATPRTRLVESIHLLAFCSLLWPILGCNTPPSQNSGALTSYSGNSSQASDKAQLFTVPQDQMGHVQIVTVAPTSIPRSLRLTGGVAFDAFNTTPVITQIGGPVSRIVVTPGQQVHRGEPLLYVSSPDYSQLLATYLKARDAFQLAARSYLRSKDLYEHHAVAERDLEAAESVRTQASVDLGAAQQSLKILGITKPDAVVGKPAAAEIPVLAPIAGEAVERLVAPGQVIQAGATQVFTISNMSTVWVVANIYQKDLPYVRMGDQATITADSYPGTEFRGKISYIAASLDPNTRTLQARIDVKNPQAKLKRDMSVVATVQAETIQNALTVPNAAVLRDTENQPYVYVVNQNKEFARRAVTLGVSAGGNAQLTSGVASGEQIVGDGSLFLQIANSSQR
jgi:membrane fusion protein, heavy metal efflux system